MARARAEVVLYGPIPPYRGTAAVYPQLPPIAEEDGPPPPRHWAVSLRGARDAQEDRVTIAGPLLCVHDGHGGAGAVEALHALAERRGRTLPARRWRDADDALVRGSRALLALYDDGRRALAAHTSGVVSVAALAAGPGQACLAGVGDAQACVVDLERGAVCDAEVQAFDSAAPEAAAAAPAPPRRGPAMTRPHALSAPRMGDWHVTVRAASDAPGVTTLVGIPRGFDDPIAQREWELASRLLVAGGRLTPGMRMPGLHAPSPAADALMRVQVHTWDLDGEHFATRFLNSPEPTRSLGNAHCAVLAHAEVFAVRFAPARGPLLLLCSDGFFDGEAFADVHALARFLRSPTEFVRADLYHARQHLTRRLRAAGQLRALEAALRACDTWPKALAFLTGPHHHAVARLGEPPEWLAAAEESLEWLAERHPARAPAGPGELAPAAAHLAVAMGSQDNVTLLLAEM